MKKQLMALGIVLMTASLAVNAGPRHGRFEDYARVIDVEPIYETVEVSHPERHCWDEDVSYYKTDSKKYTGTVLGSVIGGVLANQLHQGGGRGRDAATVAGALLGGAIGHDISDRHRDGHYVNATERRCETQTYTSYEEHLVGYRVKYRYQGQVFTTHTRDHPGKRIAVRVSVVPLDEI